MSDERVLDTQGVRPFHAHRAGSTHTSREVARPNAGRRPRGLRARTMETRNMGSRGGQLPGRDAATRGAPDSRALILLAEDEPAVRSVMRRILEFSGYRVLAAGSAEEALQAVDGVGRAPDLLLTDVVMPGMGGPQLSIELRARFPGLRVLFVSGFPKAFVTGAGAVDPGAPVLSKPFDHF